MPDYLPYGKLNEGIQHVDIGVSVALPKSHVKGCIVHLVSDDYVSDICCIVGKYLLII